MLVPGARIDGKYRLVPQPMQNAPTNPGLRRLAVPQMPRSEAQNQTTRRK